MKSTGHGEVKTSAGTRLSWNAMWQRCTDPKHPSFSAYGGDGIEVCERWRDFSWFVKDMGPRPSLGHSIDRIDNDEGYFPQNCRWASGVEQARNRRNNKIVEVDGERLCVSALAERVGMKASTLGTRIELGWDLSRATSQPVRFRSPSIPKRQQVAS